MKFYSLILFTFTLIWGGTNLIFWFDFYDSNFFYFLLLFIGSIAFIFVVDLIISAMIFITPDRWYKKENKLFKVGKWEKRFYEKIKIKSWKDIIPIGAGPFGIGFKKDKIYNKNDISYLNKFYAESCKAEVMHFLSLLSGLLTLTYLPMKYIFLIVIPFTLINLFFQILPIFVQRYIRPKLLIAIKYQEKHL